jgi:Domain of unknown function (DUF1992)
MDERLRKLSEAGELSGLPGDGRPFKREDLEGDDATWAAFRLMKNNKVIPAWSQERIDIDAELDRLRARCRGHHAWLEARAALLRKVPGDRIVATAQVTSGADDRFRDELGAAVSGLNERIDRYNAMVPSVGLALPRVSAGALLASAG